MTKRIGDTVLIAAELPALCTSCGNRAELRPYGAGGARICFPCAMKTPESKAEARRQVEKMMGGAATAIGEELPVRCPCGSSLAAVIENGRPTGLVHEQPQCDDFANRSPADFLVWLRTREKN